MKRLVISKGLAASAIGALAVTGLAVAPVAPAAAAGPGVVFMSLHNPGSDATLRYDGWDNGVSLTAARLDPAATITFQYNADPTAGDAAAGWTAVPGAVTMTGEYASLLWQPSAAIAGTEVAVRAVATVGGAATYATRHGVALARAEWGTEGVAVSHLYATPDDLGFFDQPYTSAGRTATRVSVHSFTSATGGTARVSWWNPATSAFAGTVDAAVRPSDLKTQPVFDDVYGGGEFYADLDITAFDADAGDNLALSAELDTDDVRAVPLYAQTLNSISATGPQAAVGQPTTITVSVSDSQGRPVAGVEVRRTGGALVGYTDGAGVVRDEVLGGAVPAGYYANGQNDLDAFDAATDVQTTSVTLYVPAAGDLVPVLVDGWVFDDDEYAAGDISLLATDATSVARVPVAGANVEYRVYPSASAPPATYQGAVSDSLGRVAVAFAPQGPDGSYTLDYRFAGSSSLRTVTFTAGDGTLGVTPAAAAAAPGGQVALRAGLTVAGKPLSNRALAATYARGVELVPGTKGDAALADGVNRVLALNGTTDALGAFTVTVDDPADNPQGAEKGGRLTVGTLTAALGRLTLTGNANETGTATVDFGTTRGKAKLKLKGSSAGNKDRLAVKGPDSLAGEKVTFFRISGGKKVKLRSKKLNKSGDVVLSVVDRNGDRTTTYVVKLVPSTRALASKSKKVQVD